MPQAVSLLNTQLVGTGVVPLTAGTLNLVGADLEIQRNVCPWLGFQLSISGATEGLNISIPTADASVFPTGSVFQASPEIFTGVFGPVITIRRSEHVQPWLRLMGGESRADIVPDTLFKADVRSSLSTFSFADTTVTVDGGLGVDLLVTQSLSLTIRRGCYWYVVVRGSAESAAHYRGDCLEIWSRAGEVRRESL